MSRFAGFDLADAASKVAARQTVPITFGELVAAYHACHLGQELDLMLRKWVAAFGDRDSWSIERDELARAAQAMLDAGYKPASANRALSAIGQVYRWAIDVRKCSPSGFVSPTRSIPRYPEALRRVEATAAEVNRIRSASLAFRDRRFGLFVMLLTDTGCRRGELLSLRWDRLDVEVHVAHVEGKTGHRLVAVTPETVALAARLLPPAARRGERIFISKRGGTFEWRRPWRELVRLVGRPDLTPHDLRHVAAARMLRAGVGVAVAAQALGHSSLILQRRYGHLDAAALHAAQRKGWARAGLGQTVEHDEDARETHPTDIQQAIN